MFLMLTHATKKIVDTMMEIQTSTAKDHEGVDINLIAIEEVYLENALGLKWIDMGVINHMGTWHVDPMRILLQHLKPKVVG